MQLIKSLLVSLGVFLCCACVVANQGQYIDSVKHKPYVGFELSYASSLQGDINVNEKPNHISGFVWDHPLEGWNADLGHSFGFGVNFGYNFTDLVVLELAYNYRPAFEYAKAQTVPTSTGIGTRIRYFDLSNQTLMVNSIYHLVAISDGLQSFKQRTRIEPFINIGAGVAKNTVSNFYGLCTGIHPGMIFSKMVDNTTYNFSAQLGAGFDVNLSANWAFKLGYRFLYGGNFETKDYVTDDPDAQHTSIPGSGNTANPWNGTLRANEVYVNFAYTF